MIFRIEIVHYESDHVGDEQEHDGNDLADQGDRFLDDVDDGDDAKDLTDEPNEGFHGSFLLSVELSLFQKYEKEAEMQAQFAYLCGSES